VIFDRSHGAIIARIMAINGFSRELAEAQDALRRAHQRAARKLRVAGIPGAAWRALDRMELERRLFVLAGRDVAKQGPLLAAMVDAREIFDAATSGKLLELPVRKSSGGAR
jgi:hypothetical protein